MFPGGGITATGARGRYVTSVGQEPTHHRRQFGGVHPAAQTPTVPVQIVPPSKEEIRTCSLPGVGTVLAGRSTLARSHGGRAKVENELQELQAVAQRQGWEVVATCTDEGIRGATGRDNGRASTSC